MPQLKNYNSNTTTAVSAHKSRKLWFILGGAFLVILFTVPVFINIYSDHKLQAVSDNLANQYQSLLPEDAIHSSKSYCVGAQTGYLELTKGQPSEFFCNVTSDIDSVTTDNTTIATENVTKILKTLEQDGWTRQAVPSSYLEILLPFLRQKVPKTATLAKPEFVVTKKFFYNVRCYSKVNYYPKTKSDETDASIYSIVLNCSYHKIPSIITVAQKLSH